MTDIGQVAGEAIVYNSITRIGALFDETIAPGAATRFLKSSEVGELALVLNHDSNHLLARVRSGTLVVTDSASALRIRASLPDSSSGRDVRSALERRDLYRMSFSFVLGAKGDTWHEGKDGVPLRVVRDIDRMYDVSVVTWPAYDATSVHLERSNNAVGRTVQLRRLDLNSAADRGAAFERAAFGDEIYGRRIKPPEKAAALARAKPLRVYVSEAGQTEGAHA